MRVLVGCEVSGVVRREFRERGHDAWSCDMQPADDGSQYHFNGPLESVPIGVGNHWDIGILFPPCTHLCSSGARWFEKKRADGSQKEAIDFFMYCVDLVESIGCGAIENPIGIMSKLYRKPDQIIQPWQFGHGETKATCLWLKELPKLAPTEVVSGREARVHRMSPGKDRAKNRSRTYDGIGKAMAAQWGGK